MISAPLLVPFIKVATRVYKLIGGCIITAGGGLWHTDAQPLNLLRRNVDKYPQQIKLILAGGELAEEFFGIQTTGDEQKAVKAFAERNKEDALKTAPKVSRFFSLAFCRSSAPYQYFRWDLFPPFYSVYCVAGPPPGGSGVLQVCDRFAVHSSCRLPTIEFSCESVYFEA